MWITTRILQTVGLLMVVIALVSAAHPAADMVPKSLRDYKSKTLPTEWGFGDYQFLAPEDMPEFEGLTPLERYMLAGAKSRDGSKSLLPWYEEVYSIVGMFHHQYGYIPDVLDLDKIHMISGYENATDENMAQVRNPLTGAWPRLTASGFSRGDLYIRALSESDKQSFAERDPGLQQSLYGSKAFDKDRYEAGTPYSQCFTKTAERVSDVLYVRMYGEHGIILADLVGPIYRASY